MTRYSVDGRVALVTGAARGIGFEAARALYDRGAAVALVDLDAGTAERAAADLGGGARAIGLGADVTNADAIAAAVQTTVERLGGLDIVVANAGIAASPATAMAMDPVVFERVLEVNLQGVWRTVRPALPHIASRQGHIVVVASVYAFVNGAGAAPYAMAKAGVEQLGRALRTELSVHGASASVAYFGFIDTEMVHAAIDRDEVGSSLLEELPRPLRKRLPARDAGEAIASGIEHRAPRIIRPRRWTALSVLRGIANPLADAATERREQLKAVIRRLDQPGRGDKTTA